MRKVVCKSCGQHWSARQGTILNFYQDHEQRHSLVEPFRFQGESEKDYLGRYIRWRDEYFDDSLKREEM